MSLRISDFFLEDLLDEQHIWRIDQIAMFYQTTEEEVIQALVKANDKFKDDPRSFDYPYTDSDCIGPDSDSVFKAACWDVHGDSRQDRPEAGP